MFTSVRWQGLGRPVDIVALVKMPVKCQEKCRQSKPPCGLKALDACVDTVAVPVAGRSALRGVGGLGALAVLKRFEVAARLAF